MDILFHGQYLFYNIAILCLIVLSGFFSGTETALVSANRLRIESLAQSGLKRAQRSLRILDDLEGAIGLVLIGNNVANVMATAFITFVATRSFHYNEYALLIVTVIQTVLFLIVCEVSPKILASKNAERHVMFFSGTLTVLLLLTRPVVKFSLLFSDLLKKMLNIDGDGKSIIMSRDEIDIIFRLGSEEGVIDEKKRFYVTEILSFSDITVQEIATPTIDIVSIELKKSIRELVNLITQTKFSRIPVYDKRVDNIIGYIFYRDLLKKGKAKRIADYLKPAYYVPATKKIGELFFEMQKMRVPIAFVVNEFGAVTGVVTHEDIAEEVVGEIQTADHFEEGLITKLAENRFLLDANIDIDYFNRSFNAEIPKLGFETLAGFIEYRIGRIPKKEEKFQFNNFVYDIYEATPRSIEKIMLTVKKRKRGKKPYYT